MSEISDLKSEPSDCRARLDEETEGCGRGKAFGRIREKNFCGKVTPGGDSIIPISKDLRDDLPSLLMIRLCLFKPLGISQPAPGLDFKICAISFLCCLLMPNTNNQYL